MKIDYKIVTIIILSVLICILAWEAFKPIEVVTTDNSFIKQQKQQLEQQNIQLQSDFEKKSKIIDRWKFKYDSLEQTKVKIKQKNEDDNTKVDNFNRNNVVNAFDSIFSANGIK